MTTALEECPIACPCPCPCPLSSSNENWENTWGFTESCPVNYLEPGQVIPSPGGRFSYEIVSYPFSRLFLDFKGLIAHAQGQEIVDTSDREAWALPNRQFWKCLFLLLTISVAQGELHLPPWLLLSLTGRLMPHLDNNSWEGWPLRKPSRSQPGNFLSYYRRLIDGDIVEVFTLRWTPKEVA